MSATLGPMLSRAFSESGLSISGVAGRDRHVTAQYTPKGCQDLEPDLLRQGRAGERPLWNLLHPTFTMVCVFGTSEYTRSRCVSTRPSAV